jgi:ribosomal protein L37AE/L43A
MLICLDVCLVLSTLTLDKRESSWYVYCTMNKYTCTRCKHHWISRIHRRPKECPHCKSTFWDKEYSERTLKTANRIRRIQGW